MPALETLPQILAHLGAEDADIVMVGDGSGSEWDMPGGWAVVLIDRLTRERQLLCGGLTHCSVNLAEMLPYLHALTWYHATGGKQRLHAKGLLRVHIITDSQLTADTGNVAAAPGKPLPKLHGPLWASARAYQAMGYQLTFHWAARSTSLLNWYTDLLASMSRKVVMRSGPREFTGEQVRHLRWIEAAASKLLAQHPGEAIANPLYQALLATTQALRATLQGYGHAGDWAAVAIEGIQLLDPSTGQPIDIQHLNPEPEP